MACIFSFVLWVLPGVKLKPHLHLLILEKNDVREEYNIPCLAHCCKIIVGNMKSENKNG